MRNLNYSLCCLPLPRGLLSYITAIGAPFLVETMLLSPTFKITGIHITNGFSALSAAYVGYLYIENHWVALQLWVRHGN